MADKNDTMSCARWQAFSTASVPVHERVRRWTEFGSDTLCDMVVDPLDHGGFDATLQRVEVGPIGLVFMETTAASAFSPATHVGDWAASDRDALVMTLVDHGSCHLTQNRWNVDLTQGDMVIRDLARPWRNVMVAPTRLVSVKIPITTVLKTIQDPERIVGQRLAGHLAPVSLALSVIRASRHALLTDPGGEWSRALGDILSDVFRLVCEGARWQDGRDAPRSAQNGATLGRDAVGYIMHHLHEPELTVAQVAGRLGISPRHLQRIFLAYGKTPRQFILDQRLERAAARIAASPDQGGARITDIAFDVGFNDLSHFSRAFSHRYGCPPRQYRSRNPHKP